MAEIINLRLARKARKREEAGAQAAANRAKFGQAKAEKQRRAMDEALEARRLEGARLDEEQPGGEERPDGEAGED